MFKYYCLYLLSVCGLAFGAPQKSQDGCVLPPYPAHGTYTIHNHPEAAPGQVYDLAILSVTCDPGYGVVGNNVTYCFSKNQWQQPIPKCTRFCKLDPDPSVRYFCKVTGDGLLSGTRLCRGWEPHGTVVVPECNRPVYYAAGDLLNMHCFEGTWDHVAVCQPDCGTAIAKGDAYIRNGTRVEHGELPWHAGIYDKFYTPFKQVCGGSLVSTTVIISAAHCFWSVADAKAQPAARYAVALGKIYRPWNDAHDIGAHKSDVSEIKMTPRFLGEEGHFQDDIALVFMTSPVVYVTFIRPVCIDLSEEFDRTQLKVPAKGKVSGWGLKDDGKESPVLLTVWLPFVDVTSCLEGIDDTFKPYVTLDKICAGGQDGNAVCHGDSGGGLAFPEVDRGTRRYFLRGIVSTAPRSDESCSTDTYTTFTHIQQHAAFIRDNGLGKVSIRDKPINAGGCILPEYPLHGTYTVQNKPDAVPGQIYDTVLLTVTCEPGFKVVGINTAYCAGDNKWSETSLQCSQFCKLTPHPSVKYQCRLAGTENRTRACEEFEPSGTIVVPTCDRPNYYHPGELADMHCVRGEWDHVATCQPECGITKGEPTGESQAAYGDVPWQAGVYDKNISPYSQVCGGSLVSATLVISAAHCFYKDVERLQSPSRYGVALGKVHRSWNDPMDSGAHQSDVLDIKIPRRFRGKQTAYKDDIAILLLATPVTYSDNIRPVCLDFSVEFDRTQLQGTTPGRAAGWGLSSEDGAPSPLLKTMELAFVDEETCIEHVPQQFISAYTSDKICASPTKGVVCKGDAGGGLAYQTVDSQGTRRFYLRGIIAMAPKEEHECNVKADILLTHVLKHEKFIKEHLNNNFV